MIDNCWKDNWSLKLIISCITTWIHTPIFGRCLVLPIHLFLSVTVHLVNVPLLKLLQDVIYFALIFAIFSGIQQPNSSLYYSSGLILNYTQHTYTRFWNTCIYFTYYFAEIVAAMVKHIVIFSVIISRVIK